MAQEKKIFFIDYFNSIEKTYADLLSDISGNDLEFTPFCYTSDYYLIFKQIIISLMLDKEITILDYDLSGEEIEGLGIKEALITQRFENPLRSSLTFDNFLSTFSNHDKWRINLFTSGTTGQPKKVSHTFKSITKSTRQAEKHAKSIWGYAYNPTHIAGIQVFFQALLNKNSIIRIFGYSKKDIQLCLKKFKVTHLSGTPTFYRLLVDNIAVFPSIKNLTFGGEKFDKRLSDSLSRSFPNAKILNVYASTEAGTIFASSGETFTIKEKFESNVKIKDNEILIHESIIGISSNIKLIDSWYHTGDLVEVISKDPLEFKFSSRKNEMINVGGYKVNPNEVEQVILSMPEVYDVSVFSKPNSVVGNLLCCNIVLQENYQLSVKQLKDQLSATLQPFKIPRIVKFVDSIEKTKTGKKKRL